MSVFSQPKPLFAKPHLRLIALVGVIVPRRLRADWRQEWEAELRYREILLEEWERLGWRTKLDLLRRSASAFRDALWLQQLRWEDEMFQDLRFGVRMLTKNKGFTAAAVLCLALGIGANTAIFSLINALLLRPLPVPQPDQVITIARGAGLGPPLSYPDFLALRERNQVLSDLAAWDRTALNFGHGTQSEVITGELVSDNFFQTLGIVPTLGRAFLPEEGRTPGTHPVVVLSHNFWQRQFAGNPNIIGQTIVLNNYPFTVVGVTPADFTGVSIPFASSLWVPIMMAAQTRPLFPLRLDNRRDETFGGIGRLKEGISLVQAQAALETLNHQIELSDPPPVGAPAPDPADRALSLTRPEGFYIPHWRRRAQIATTLLAAVVGIVLMIACANVANLLLARAAVRRKEIAIRLALGAGRWRLVRQLLTESVLLALLGGLAGLLLAFCLSQLFMALKPPLPESWGFKVDLRLDGLVLAFTLLLSLVVSLVFGLVPALQTSKPDLIPGLKAESGAESRSTRRHWRRVNLRNALVVVQIAVSLVLLITAGLFARSLQYTQMIDPGFQTENRLTVSFNLAKQGYDEPKERDFSARLVERVGALPGVQSVTLTNFLPLGLMSLAEPLRIEGRDPPPDGQVAFAAAHIIGQDYFRTIGTELVRGRDFTAQDTANSPQVAIINETMARRFWPNEDALGKRVRIGRSRENPPLREVIGIVKDTAVRSLGEDPQLVTYRPLAQQRSSLLTLVVHTSGGPKSLIPSIRREVQALDDNLPTQESKTLNEIVAFSLWPMRMAAGLVGGFGLLGLMLATLGIYGVMSYAVAQRTREIGVRMALGAQARDVLKLIVGQGLTLTLTGAGIGMALAFVVTRVLVNLLYGVGATDPVTFAGVALFLMLISLVACVLPARRATKVDPLAALRHE